MKVVDADGIEVGTIGLIRFGDPSAAQVNYQPSEVAGSAFATDLVRSEPRVPEPLRGSLLQLGMSASTKSCICGGTTTTTSCHSRSWRSRTIRSVLDS